LGLPPLGATHLLAELDSGHAVVESHEGNNSISWKNQLAGEAWWYANQASYPNSTDLADLDGDIASGFEHNVRTFLNAIPFTPFAEPFILHIESTRRPPQRQELMYWSWAVTNHASPSSVEAIAGVDILWDYGDKSLSEDAARQMMDLFDVVHQPARGVGAKISNHVTGLAIDMDLTWTNSFTMAVGPQGMKYKGNKYQPGDTITVPGPGTGASSALLWTIGESYGVFKKKDDPPHWSTNGK
jgi:hypothetical protein